MAKCLSDFNLITVRELEKELKTVNVRELWAFMKERALNGLDKHVVYLGNTYVVDYDGFMAWYKKIKSDKMKPIKAYMRKDVKKDKK